MIQGLFLAEGLLESRSRPVHEPAIGHEMELERSKVERPNPISL